jgi:hypothetical protein
MRQSAQDDTRGEVRRVHGEFLNSGAILGSTMLVGSCGARSRRSSSAVIRHNPNRQRLIDSLVDCGARSLMLAAFLVVLRSFAMICSGHRAVALENLASVNSWRCSSAPSSVRHSVREIDCFGCCSLTPGGTGVRL